MTEYTETPTNNSSPNFLTIYKEDNGGNLINAEQVYQQGPDFSKWFQ